MDSVAELVNNFTLNMDETEITSPSQLEEVTLDAETSLYSAGLRSPLLGSRGRSIKEFEEQLSGLRKENFNLKLRIYFLEERMGTNCNMDQEDAVKKNIELMVEQESLKKELQEKQDLLCQAVKAMELEEDEHRKENEKKEKELKDVRLQLETVQQQCDTLQEEMHSPCESQERDYFSSAMNVPDESQGIISILENRIADLEEQLRSEKSEQIQNDTASLALTIDQLKAKLKDRDDKLRDAQCELTEKCLAIDDLQTKLTAKEMELRERSNEIGALKRKLEQTLTDFKNHHLSMEELRKLNEECSTMFESECKRNERNRLAIANRNTKIAELEGSIEKYKTQVANLELKLETAVNEVKMRSSPSHAEYSPAARPIASQAPRKQTSPNYKSKNNHSSASGDEAADANASPVDEKCSELVKYKRHVSSLEADQLKACHIIQTLLETRKKNGKEIEELQRSLQKRDAIINGMRESGAASKSPGDKKTIQERVSELNLTAAAPSTDTERASPEDEHDPHLLLEQYKIFINEIDAQKRILTQNLNEKDTLIEELEAKYEDLYKEFKAKENRIVDLEFELLNVPDNDAAKSALEKVDTGTEKVSFWIKESEDKDREIEKLEKELAKRTHDLQTIVNKELWQKNREIEKLQKYVTDCDKKDQEITKLIKEVAESENKLMIYTLKIQEYEEAKLRERKMIQEKLNTSNEDRNDLLIEVNELNHQIASMVKETSIIKEELKLSDALRIDTQEVCAMLGKRLEELATFLDTLLKQKSVLGFLGFKQNKLLRQKVEQSLDLSRNLSLTLEMNSEQSLLQLSNISELLNSTAMIDGMPSIDLTRTTLSIIPDDISLTYQNTLNVRSSVSLKDDQSEVIQVLRSQIDKLKGEIEIRDRELSQRMSINSLRQNELIDQLAEFSGAANNTALSPEEILQRLKLNEKVPNQQCDNSDSESWSEPDRDVSKARIGLDDEALKPKAKMISESTEMEARPVSRTPSKKSVNSESRCAISQLTEQLGQKDDLLSQASMKHLEIETKYNDITQKYEELNAKCRNLENGNANLNKEYKDLDNLYQALQTAYTKEQEQLQATITERNTFQQSTKDLEEKLRSAMETKTAAENEVILLGGKIENLESYKVMLTESMETKTKFIENRLNQLEVEKNQAQQDTKAAECKLDEALKEIARITDKLLSVEFNHAKSTSTLIDDAEKEVQRRVKEIEHDFEDRVRTIEHNAHIEVRKIREAAESIAIKYERDYVEKSEMERLKAMIQELESVQGVLKLTEQKVRQLETSESTLKQQLFDCECKYRNTLNDLRRDLDAATLQCSQLQLDKSTCEEERIHLQAQLKQFNDREELFETQVADLKNDFSQLKDNFKRQLHALETEKSHLEVKVCSLETLNADLQNQIIKLQCTPPEMTKAQSAPSSPTGRILNMYLAKNQLYRQGNYVNNELYSNYQRNNENIENVEEVDRIQANSSPDLGIESDQGRFSSLEANVMSVRPLQPSIELAVSMSDNFDQHQRGLVSTDNCGNDKCNRAVKEMHSENHLLKKKLLKSNKLLEDTLSQLAKANQRKREVEKNICKQIHQTSQVLKIARANLDSGSDSELARK